MSELLATVKTGGLFTTIQDLGRPGFRQYGVPLSGALDQPSAMVANELVGNCRDAPLLEITQIGPVLTFHQYGALAISGADMAPTLNGVPITNYQTTFFSKGDQLVFGPLKRGLRTYLSFAGELQAEVLFGSKSTHTGNQMGGYQGRALQSGDQLFLTSNPKLVRIKRVEPVDRNTDIIRVHAAPEFEALQRRGQQQFFDQKWVISPESNRTGIRLKGNPIAIQLPEMISSPTDVGIVQLPPSGQPIVLMHDSSAVGGYPRIFAVWQQDLPLLAQKVPGEAIQFKYQD